jgi:hypothetical protein
MPEMSLNDSLGSTMTLTREQSELADYIERCARCLSKTQLDNLRADFSERGNDMCAICGVEFWSLYFTVPYQRHHCHCCGKALCNKCTVTVEMENGHRSQDGHYVKDFDWVGKFCITHELSSGETKATGGRKTAQSWRTVSVLNCLVYAIRIGGVIVSIVPAVRPLYWAYRLTRLFV